MEILATNVVMILARLVLLIHLVLLVKKVLAIRIVEIPAMNVVMTLVLPERLVLAAFALEIQKVSIILQQHADLPAINVWLVQTLVLLDM